MMNICDLYSSRPRILYYTMVRRRLVIIKPKLQFLDSRVKVVMNVYLASICITTHHRSKTHFCISKRTLISYEFTPKEGPLDNHFPCKYTFHLHTPFALRTPNPSFSMRIMDFLSLKISDELVIKFGTGN